MKTLIFGFILGVLCTKYVFPLQLFKDICSLAIFKTKKVTKDLQDEVAKMKDET